MKAAIWVLAASAACGRAGYDGIYDDFDHRYVVSTSLDRLAGPSTISSPDDLDPGTEGLSLREALTIAANTPGSDVIRFDGAAFDGSLGASIELTSPLPAITSDDTAIDSTGLPVVVDPSQLGEPMLVVDADRAIVRGLIVENATVGGIDVQSAVGFTAEDMIFRAHTGPAISVLDSVEVRIAGVTVDGTAGARLAVLTGDPAFDSAISLDTVRGGKVADNLLIDIYALGIRVAGGTNVTVQNNRLERAGADLIQLESSSELSILDNVLVVGDKSAQLGINLNAVTDSVVQNNIVDPGEARLINLQDSSDNVIEANIVDQGTAGIALFGESHRNMIIRNVSIGNQFDGFYFDGVADGNTLVHNTSLNNPAPITDESAANTETNNLLTDDPTDFVDAAGYDFRLVPNSPYIDAAIDLGYDLVPGDDARYLGNAPDMGAVETR